MLMCNITRDYTETGNPIPLFAEREQPIALWPLHLINYLQFQPCLI